MDRIYEAKQQSTTTMRCGDYSYGCGTLLLHFIETELDRC